MGLSKSEAIALGLGHLYPELRSDVEVLREQFGIEMASGGGPEPERRDAPIAVRRRSPSPDGLNKTERSFAKMLEEGSLPHLTQAVKLRLAGRTWYTPDFLVFPLRSSVLLATFVEIKGYMRDDAAVKIKVAAEQYPQFRWLLVRRWKANGWDVREVTDRGIGTEPLSVPWIAGS